MRSLARVSADIENILFETDIRYHWVQEKLCFFTLHCNPSLAYIAVRDLQSSQCNASVQSLLLAGNFLYNQ